MIALLIPYFLVTLFDENAWEHGPEYVFDVETNITSIPMDHDGVHRANYTVMNLFCRPRRPYSLYCHTANCRRQSADMTNDNRIDVSEDEIRHFCSDDPFEVNFNEYGVDHLIVNERIRVSNLNDLKLIVERFNIGADLNGVPDGALETVENTTIGQCTVHSWINHFPTTGAMNKMKRHQYELESLPQLNKVPGESLVIQKSIDLNNCSRYAPFYFGSYGSNNVVVEPDLDSHLESSTSRIFLSDDHFVSSMTRVGTMGSDKMNNLVAITQYVSVALRDIRAAKRELAVDIPAAAKTTIQVNSDVINFSGEINDV